MSVTVCEIAVPVRAKDIKVQFKSSTGNMDGCFQYIFSTPIRPKENGGA